MTKDILSRIADRDAAEEKARLFARPARPRGTNWRVFFGDVRKPSYRLYTYKQARKVAARFNRLFKTDCAYATR